MMFESSPSSADRNPAFQESEPAIDVFQILSRQRWIIIFCVALGLTIGVLYAVKATDWYQSTAKILVNPKSPSTASGTQSDVLEEDVLANHMEILRSRKIVEGALAKDGLLDLPSIKPHLREDRGEDAADYVIKRLDIITGGSGAAKTARSLSITFSHTDPEETRRILESVLVEYQNFIAGQLESVMLKTSEFISQAKNDVEVELRAAELEHLKARKAAPLMFQGVGSSNVYQDKYRRIEEELLNIEIEESSLRTRLAGVTESLAAMEKDGRIVDHLDKLALIDSDSLQRLGLFAGLQMNSVNTTDFQAAQPARMAEAQTQYQLVLELISEKKRLTSKFGSGHPQVQDIQDQIDVVSNFLAEKESTTTAGLDGIGALSPEALLRAYIGFLNHDLAALRQRKLELETLAKHAEAQAKTLIDFELNDVVLSTKVQRQQALFDAVVLQLREMDTATGLSGYIYELLVTPRSGVKAWPSRSLCALSGLILGLFAGLFLAVANDIRDVRFRSASELERFIKMPILGRIGKLNSMRKGVKGLIATGQTPDAEAIRMIRTFLLPDVRSGKLRALGMTSPTQGDGKSTVASNLAASFSQLDLSVLVIDADLRRPSLHHYFSCKRDYGLSDVLSGELDLADAIRETRIENVAIMPAGSATASPAELLQSREFDNLLELMCERYDLVLLDLPPVLAVSDPLVVAPKLGGVIMVVRAATARRSAVSNATQRLLSANSKLVGCVLNTFGAGKKFSADEEYFGYYHSDYTQSERVASRQLGTTNGKAGKVITSRAADTEPESVSVHGWKPT